MNFFKNKTSKNKANIDHDLRKGKRLVFDRKETQVGLMIMTLNLMERNLRRGRGGY